MGTNISFADSVGIYITGGNLTIGSETDNPSPTHLQFIYDILGREIKLLVNNEFKQAGRYTAEFNGSQYASGIYTFRIQVEGGQSYTAVKKMALVK